MITIDREKCRRCGTCAEVCPQLTISFEEGAAPIQTRARFCMECGACAKNCPEGAIMVAAGVGCFSALLRETLTGKKVGECGCG